MKKNLFTMVQVILFTILSVSTVLSQNVVLKSKLTLADCLQYAKENSADIKGAMIDEKIAAKKVMEVLGAGLPQVSATGDFVDNIELPTQILPGELMGAPGTTIPIKMGSKYSLGFTGKITQLVFDMSFWHGLEAASTSEKYYKQNLESITEQVTYKVAAAYYQTLAAQKQKQLLQINLSSMEKSLADAKLLFQNGRAKEVDVERLKVGCNNLKYTIKQADEGQKQSLNNLKFQMGMSLSRKIEIDDAMIEKFESETSNSQVTDNSFGLVLDYNNRIDYNILQTTKDLYNLDLKSNVSKYYPSLVAFGSYTYQTQQNTFTPFSSKDNWFDSYSVGLQLRIPIFTGGQTLAKVQQSELALQKLETQIKKAESGIDLELSNAETKLQNSLNSITQERDNVSLAKKVYSITELEYNQGVTTTASLIDSENKLREAQTNYINSLLDMYVAKLDYEKAKGTLNSYLSSK